MSKIAVTFGSSFLLPSSEFDHNPTEARHSAAAICTLWEKYDIISCYDAITRCRRRHWTCQDSQNQSDHLPNEPTNAFLRMSFRRADDLLLYFRLNLPDYFTAKAGQGKRPRPRNCSAE